MQPSLRMGWTLLALGCFAALPALAQTGALNWRRDLQQAIADAQRTRMPLMFWITGGSSGDREEDIEQDQRKTFRDPAVAATARKYIAVQISRSANKDLLEKWQLPPRTTFEVVFTTPAGEVIDRLAPSGVGHPDSFRQKMNLVYTRYRGDLFRQEVQPKLTGDAAAPAEVDAALKLISDFRIREADATLIELAAREGIDAGLRQKLLGALADLSTPSAGKALYAAAAAGDQDASDALVRCDPPVAEQLLEKLDSEDPAERVFVYNVVTRICKVKSPKPDRFWEGTNEKIKSDEMTRVKKAVEKAARDWSRKNESD